MNMPDQSIAMSYPAHTYVELRQQIHRDLRIQHPEWEQPNGESPICDSYEAHLMGQLDTFTQTDPTSRSSLFIALSNRALEAKTYGICATLLSLAHDCLWDFRPISSPSCLQCQPYRETIRALELDSPFLFYRPRQLCRIALKSYI
jgi:hypothetical protein